MGGDEKGGVAVIHGCAQEVCMYTGEMGGVMRRAE